MSTTIKPFSKKARRFIRRHPRDDAKINVLWGPVRSAKTWAINAKLVGWLSDGWWPGGIGLITARSKQAAKTNMLNDIFAMVGEDGYRYNSNSGELWLLKRPFLVIGASDESSWKAIRGATVGVWIGDELTLYPRSFWDMAISRLSLPESRMYGSTNPDNPHHYLKTDYIDDLVKQANGDFWSCCFPLDNNPNITEKTKAFLHRQYTGVFKLRYIDGLWVTADGAIYRDSLSEENYYTDDQAPPGLIQPGGHERRVIGVDYGTHNPCVFIDSYDDGKCLWWDRVYYWDSVKEARQKTDSEYADDMKAFIDRSPAQATVVLDPSAASFRVELMSRGIYVIDADNEVMEGIRMMSTMLSRNLIKINRSSPYSEDAIRELQTYAWNTKRIGIDEPINQRNHYPDSGRYIVRTTINPWRLAD